MDVMPTTRAGSSKAAGAARIRILDGKTELARHRRSYDTGRTIEDPAHLEGLLAATRQANPPSRTGTPYFPTHPAPSH